MTEAAAEQRLERATVDAFASVVPVATAALSISSQQEEMQAELTRLKPLDCESLVADFVREYGVDGPEAGTVSKAKLNAAVSAIDDLASSSGIAKAVLPSGVCETHSKLAAWCARLSASSVHEQAYARNIDTCTCAQAALRD